MSFETELFDIKVSNNSKNIQMYRQRSGKGVIRKNFPTPKNEAGKNKLTIRYLYHENLS